MIAWVKGGVSRLGSQGSNVYLLCAEPKENKHFRPGTQSGGLVTGVTEKLFVCQTFMRPFFGVAQTVPKRGRFDETAKTTNCIAFYPLKTRVSLLRPPKTTKMTKMAGVTQAKAWFRKNPGLFFPDFWPLAPRDWEFQACGLKISQFSARSFLGYVCVCVCVFSGSFEGSSGLGRGQNPWFLGKTEKPRKGRTGEPLQPWWPPPPNPLTRPDFDALFDLILTWTSWPNFRNKKSAQRGSFRSDVPGTSGQKLRSGPPSPGKTSILARTCRADVHEKTSVWKTSGWFFVPYNFDPDQSGLNFSLAGLSGLLRGATPLGFQERCCDAPHPCSERTPRKIARSLQSGIRQQGFIREKLKGNN